MSVFLISTYVVKPDKQEEYKAMYRRWLEYKKENPEEVKELEPKSWRIFTQTFGDAYGKHMEIYEFDSIADYERFVERASKNKEHSEIFENQMLFFVPGTVSNSIWNPVDISTF
jgi:hypothetical protein